MLEELATSEQQVGLTVQVQRISDEKGELEIKELRLNTGVNPRHINYVVDVAQWAVSFIQRGTEGANQVRIVIQCFEVEPLGAFLFYFFNKKHFIISFLSRNLDKHFQNLTPHPKITVGLVVV